MSKDQKENGLSCERLRQKLVYDPATGVFRWRESRAHLGRIAGEIERSGHRRIEIDGITYRAHRLAWLYMTGEWPTTTIDHANLNRDDNRFENLRPATQSQQNANTGLRCTNRCGLKGVRYRSDLRTKPWNASIKQHGKTVHLGYFSTREEAHAAYYEAAKRTFGEFARAA